LEALMAGEHASILTFGMIDPEELKVSIWVDPVTFDIERITLVDPANQEADEDTIWQIDFWNFNTRFEIAAPSVDQGKTP
ncbi:MAG: hypothetical protein KIS80_10535, partial [Anaerolineales bacterium]|nr:hypothetical protein [Anaerolineales bacterium]